MGHSARICISAAESMLAAGAPGEGATEAARGLCSGLHLYGRERAGGRRPGRGRCRGGAGSAQCWGGIRMVTAVSDGRPARAVQCSRCDIAWCRAQYSKVDASFALQVTTRSTLVTAVSPNSFGP